MPNDRLVEDLRRVRQEGFQEGVEKGRQEIVDWLQIAYLADDAPERGTPEAEAILTVARDASKHFRDLIVPKAKVRKR